MDVEVKGGVLLKRSRNRSAWSSLGGVNWQMRQISVSETRIAYGNVDGPPKDFIPLNSQTTCEVIDIDGKDFGFKVTTGIDELILVCKDAQERTAWMEAVKSVSGSCGDAEQDRLNDLKEKQALDAEKAKLAASNTGSVLSGMGNLSVTGLAEKAAKEAKERLEAEAAARAAAQKAKEEAQKKLEVPNACQKKLSNESSFHQRYIWINRANKEFHWGKTDDINKSKCIDIPSMVKDVRLDNNNALPNFTIELQNAESVFSGGLFKEAATTIDITMDDATKCAGFLNYIKELKYHTRNEMTKAASALLQGWTGGKKEDFQPHASAEVKVEVDEHKVNATGIEAVWEARRALGTLPVATMDEVIFPEDHVLRCKVHNTVDGKDVVTKAAFHFDNADEKVVKFHVTKA
eukprot:TRINITY_DN61143_c0_g1_i1.p1 TRINITY_DN61143_c0_g1~~TRINITY_DN61143_c0_g1_i1.p1  ORF type:complete len:405 (-),score=49.78 TRINITY_DN61143_c0_g1_i1:59-1273(-)